MKKIILALSISILCFFSSGKISMAEVVSPGSTVNLQNFLMPVTNQMVYLSSGEVFSTQVVGNQAIQCKNSDCSSFQKIIQTNGGYGLQGENYWDSNNDGTNEPNTTFQYRRDDGSLVPWLPTSMTVGQTYNTGAFNVVGYHINGTQLEQFKSQEVAGMDLKLDFVGPVEFPTGIKVDNVAIVKVMSGPGAGEVFYYAEGVGWIGWEGPSGNNYINQAISNFNGQALKIIKAVTTLSCGSKQSTDTSSRPAECDTCNQTTKLANSCATTFEAQDQIGYEKNEGDLCNEQWWVSKSWGNKVSSNIFIDPSSLIIPFVGKKNSEDETKFLADYFEGTNEYYKTYSTSFETMNRSGVFRKLTPMEYQDQLKKELVARTASNNKGKVTDEVLHNYKIDYKQRLCWDTPILFEAFTAVLNRVGIGIPLDVNHYCIYADSPLWIAETPMKGFLALSSITPFKMTWFETPANETATVNDFKDNSHQPPTADDPDYNNKWNAWKEKDGGKWYRLWQAMPMFTREDSMGKIIPFAGLKPGQPAEDEGFEITNKKATEEVKFPHLARLSEVTQKVQQLLFPFQDKTAISDNSIEAPQLLASSQPDQILAQAQENAYNLQISANVSGSNGNYSVGYQVNGSRTAAGEKNECFGGDWGYNISVFVTRASGQVEGLYGPNFIFHGGGSAVWEWGFSYGNDGDGVPSFNINAKPGDSVTIAASGEGPNPAQCQINRSITTSCTVNFLDKAPWFSGCAAPAPVAPACGQLEAKQVNLCQKEALLGNEGDKLCTKEGIITAKLWATDKVINDQHINCPAPGCTESISKDVFRKIGINVSQPYLEQIWTQTGNKITGLFNVLRPSIQTFEDKDAISTTKMTYQYEPGKESTQQGDVYYKHLGGVQLAKEWIIRLLSPIE